MANLFQSIPVKPPKKNLFNLSHEVKSTTDFMRTTPIACEKTVGGERFAWTSDILVRMLATVAPIMHNINIYTHFFFVPRRLLWSDWQDYIGGGKDGTYNVSRPAVPLLDIANKLDSLGYHIEDGSVEPFLGIGSIIDYLGLYPVQKFYIDNTWNSTPNTDQLAFPIPIEPLLALAKIKCDYYIDENLSKYKQWEEYVDLGYTVPSFWSSPDSWPNTTDFNDFFVLLFGPMNRAWRKDLFTSALPWQQRGPAVRVPVEFDPTQMQASIRRSSMLNFGGHLGPENANPSGTTPNVQVRNQNGRLDYVSGDTGNNVMANPIWYPDTPSSEQNFPASIVSKNGSNITGELLLQELRYTMKVQEFFEKDARGGYRYSEVLLSHFGVRPQDARLQRAEFLGGGKTPLVVSQVANTSSGDSSNPQGNLAGIGVSRQRTHQFNYFTPEHGWIIGVMTVMPHSNYMDGVRREFYALKRFDEYWPTFAHLGEQPIQPMELNVSAGYSEINNSDNPFGYTPRYAEYKVRQDSIHGAFRTTLKYWHLAREFGSTVPTLSEEFITSPPNSDRIFATSSDIPANTDHLLFQCYHRIKAIRPMPKYGVPSF